MIKNGEYFTPNFYDYGACYGYIIKEDLKGQ